MARVGVLAVALALLLAADAGAVTRTWDGGCGVDTKWSCAANWSEDADPDKDDAVVFAGTATGNSTVDSSFSGAVASVRIKSGYSGTITMASSLQVLGPFTQLGGTFTAANQALTLRGLSVRGGSFTASSGTTAIGAGLRISEEATFDANEGTIDFNGKSSATLSCAEASFEDVVFTHTGGTKTVGPSCSLPLGNDPSAGSGGGIRLKGELTGTGTITAFKKLILGGTGELSGFSGLKASTAIVEGSYDFGEYEPFTVAADFSVAPGASVTAPEGDASFGKNFTIGSGATFDANEGTVRFTAKSPFAIVCDGEAFSSVVFESFGQKTIGSDCTLPLGPNPSLGPGGTVLNGTLSGSGELSQTGALEIGSIEPGLDSFEDVLVKGSLVLTPTAEFTAPEGTLTITGHFTVATGATFDANEGTVAFDAPYRTSRILACGEVVFNQVVFINGGKQIVGADCSLPLGANPTVGDGGEVELNGTLTGTGTLTADSPLLTLGATSDLSGFSGLASDGALKVAGVYDFDEYAPFAVEGDFTIVSGGEVVAPEATAEFGGDFVNGGTFEDNGGEVVLVGGDQVLTGSTTFEDLTKIAVEAEKLTFAAGSTQTVDGALTLEGFSAGKRLSLISSTTGTKWNLAGVGSRTAKWLSVKDSNNTGAEISAVESIDAGNNAGWSF